MPYYYFVYRIVEIYRNLPRPFYRQIGKTGLLIYLWVFGKISNRVNIYQNTFQDITKLWVCYFLLISFWKHFLIFNFVYFCFSSVCWLTTRSANKIMLPKKRPRQFFFCTYLKPLSHEQYFASNISFVSYSCNCKIYCGIFSCLCQ